MPEKKGIINPIIYQVPKIEYINETGDIIKKYFGKITVNPAILPEKSEFVGREFDMIVDYGDTLKPLQDPIPAQERLIENQPHLQILSLTDPAIAIQMGKITDLANDPAKSPDKSEDRQEYRGNLEQVYQAEARKLNDKIGNKKALIFAPRNGGIFVKDTAQEILNGENISWFGYRMSRIQKKDGGLMVGIQLDENNPALEDFDTFVFFDDCMASFISCAATMEMIKNNLIAEGVNPASKELLIAVSAGVQRSMQEITSEEAQNHFGFKDISAVTGILVFAMNDHYYLIDAENPQKQIVGDMGNWTRKPGI